METAAMIAKLRRTVKVNDMMSALADNPVKVVMSGIKSRVGTNNPTPVIVTPARACFKLMFLYDR